MNSNASLRILFVCLNSPYPPTTGGRQRSNLIYRALEQCGHFLPEESPDAVCEALLDFFGSARSPLGGMSTMSVGGGYSSILADWTTIGGSTTSAKLARIEFRHSRHSALIRAGRPREKR